MEETSQSGSGRGQRNEGGSDCCNIPGDPPATSKEALQRGAEIAAWGAGGMEGVGSVGWGGGGDEW